MLIFFRISSSSVSKRTTFIIQRSQVSISVSRQFCKMLQRGLSVNRLVISFDNENLSSRKMKEIWSLVNADQISSQVSARFKIAPPEVVNACKIIRIISEENISLSQCWLNGLLLSREEGALKIFVFGSVLWLKDWFLETSHCQIQGEYLHLF